MTASIGLASSHWSSSFGIRIWITIFRHTRIEWLNFWSLSSAARAVESLVRVSFPILLDMFVVLLLDSTPNPDAVKIYNGNPKHITYGSSATLKGQYGDSSFIYLLKWIFLLIDILMDNDARIGFIYSRWRWLHPFFLSIIILCLCSLHSLYMMQMAYYIYWMGNEKCGKKCISAAFAGMGNHTIGIAELLKVIEDDD